MKLYGKAGILNDDNTIIPAKNAQDELYFNVDENNYNYVSDEQIVYASTENIKNKTYITKQQLNNAIISFMKHYRIPYSDNNVSVLAKIALNYCTGEDIINFIKSGSNEKNMYDYLIRNTDIDMFDNDYIDNVPKLVQRFKLDFGNKLTNRLMSWINDCIIRYSKLVFDDDDHYIVQREYLTEIAFLQQMQNALSVSNQFEKAFYHLNTALYDKLTSYFDFLSLDAGLLNTAQEMIAKHTDINYWNEDDCVYEFIDTLNTYC